MNSNKRINKFINYYKDKSCKILISNLVNNFYKKSAQETFETIKKLYSDLFLTAEEMNALVYGFMNCKYYFKCIENKSHDNCTCNDVKNFYLVGKKLNS